MPFIDVINAAFGEMLQKFSRGISNTSTSKYDVIKPKVAEVLGIPIEEVYATGAAGRTSNLDTRLAQGNQRNQHTALALVFLKHNLEGKDREVVVQRSRESFTATAAKFVTGEERGTTFDAILGFLQIEDEPVVQPLRLLTTADNPNLSKILSAFPDVDVRQLPRTPTPPPASPASLVSAGDVQPRRPINPGIDQRLLGDCAEDIDAAGLRLPPGMLGRYLASLLSKRFVILSGLSGSGKTKLALSVASWFQEVDEQIEVVAVGADWTSNEHILGYRDALDPTKYRRPTNGCLDLVLAAISDSRRPYFLILDEMNLSHVERYFADLLSAIESGQPLALHSDADEVEGVAPRITLPPNLFVVGTVNVDETTYTFSPKVLDRANVIEFRASKAEMRAFLKSPAAIDLTQVEGRGKAYGPVFADAAAHDETPLNLLPHNRSTGEGVAELYEVEIGRIFEILSPHGAEFGYRTAREIARLVYAHSQLVGPDWTFDAALDAAIVQKIMPKLHGSERRLRPLLDDLATYFEKRALPLSSDKLLRMKDRLRDGFASFLDS